jgi:hypothetical protein
MPHSRKEQEPEGAFSPFTTNRIASDQTRGTTEQKRGTDHTFKDPVTDLSRCGEWHEPNQRRRANEYAGCSNNKPCPIITPAPRPHSEFALEDRQDGHPMTGSQRWRVEKSYFRVRRQEEARGQDRPLSDFYLLEVFSGVGLLL